MGQGNNTVIVTGGAGYVGSHVVVKLCEAGYRTIIIDNFCNSSPSVVVKLELLTGSSIEVAALDMQWFGRSHVRKLQLAPKRTHRRLCQG